MSGQVNANAPRVFGDGVIHVSQLDAVVKGDAPLPELPVKRPSSAEDAVGSVLADNLIDDGATLQLGNCLSFCCTVDHKTSRVRIYSSYSAETDVAS